MDTTKNANALIDDIVSGPNPLDKFMRADPKTLNAPVDYPAMVAQLRSDRAAFIKADAAKKDKKAGVVDPDVTQEESEQ